MSNPNPLRVGIAFALTIAGLYLGCLVLMLAWPGLVLGVFSTWVHGLNLHPLFTGAPPISIGRAMLGLLSISGYAFIAGVLYGWVRRLVGA